MGVGSGGGGGGIRNHALRKSALTERVGWDKPQKPSSLSTKLWGTSGGSGYTGGVYPRKLGYMYVNAFFHSLLDWRKVYRMMPLHAMVHFSSERKPCQIHLQILRKVRSGTMYTTPRWGGGDCKPGLITNNFLSSSRCHSGDRTPPSRGIPDDHTDQAVWELPAQCWPLSSESGTGWAV